MLWEGKPLRDVNEADLRQVIDGAMEETAPLRAGDYLFPTLLVDDFANVESTIHSLCDHAHQTFGNRQSPCFDRDGNWIGVR